MGNAVRVQMFSPFMKFDTHPTKQMETQETRIHSSSRRATIDTGSIRRMVNLQESDPLGLFAANRDDTSYYNLYQNSLGTINPMLMNHSAPEGLYESLKTPIRNGSMRESIESRLLKEFLHDES